MEENRRRLFALVNELRRKISKGPLRARDIEDATKRLKQLGKSYKDETFPELLDTNTWKDESSNSPKGLAEALLWKLGRWKAYRNFANYYAYDQSKPRNDIVFYAFARHLKKPNKNPMFDQHSLRALWAICPNLTPEEEEKCKNYLIDTQDRWKGSGSGTSAAECYNIFKKRLKSLITKSGARTLRELDRLLMPLGQAIREHTKNYREFDRLHRNRT